jgi:lysophospholipase L1-like esterase
VPATGIPFNTTVVQVNAAIKQLANQNGYLVVDYYTPLLNDPQDFPDGLHPNAAGYAIMEQALAGVVSR